VSHEPEMDERGSIDPLKQWAGKKFLEVVE
jgi:hypothetical protein